MAATKKRRNHTDPIVNVRSALLFFRKMRDDVKEMDKQVKDDQPEIIALMKEADPDNNGIIFDEDDKSKGTGYVQQNEATEVWDEDEIWEYVRKRSALRSSVTSRVLDIRKWEAEVANGNVPAKVANRFKKKLDPPKPFIRFGKKGDGSI